MSAARADQPDRVPVERLTDTRSDRVLREGTHTGPTDPATRLTAQVFFRGDANGLADYARAVSDPADPRYGRFLTPERTRARFGPARQRIDAVTAWLRDTGLAVDAVSSLGVVVSGTVAQATAAFGTRFANYTLGGTPYRAAVDPITVPADVAADVLAVTGLTAGKPGKPDIPVSSGALPANRTRTPDEAARRTAAPTNPCPAHFGDTPATDLPPAYGRPAQWAPCGYTPKQVRDAYGITGTGLTGRGATIGIIGSSYEVNALADANRFAAEHGEPTLAPGQFTAHVAPGASTADVSGEFAMDIQAAHAMAPEANIAYVVGSRTQWGDPVLDAIATIVDRRLADVVSGSVLSGFTPGWAPDAIAAYERLFQEAAVEGITFAFASGDSGGGLVDGVRTVEYPSSSPWVTAVGGTTLAIGPRNSHLWEVVWATEYTDLSADGTRWDPEPPGHQEKATGGGVSTVFGQPFYQRGVVPATFAGSPRGRAIPDVSALADPDLGLLIGLTQYHLDGSLGYVEENGGGTSLASPLFAGVAALIVQARGPLGFANPALYARGHQFRRVHDNPAGTPDTIAFAVNRHGSVRLVTPGQYENANLDFAPGYNTATGLGSPTRELIDSFRGTPQPQGGS
ncbi:subtilase family serine protease [Saccharothrix coeruleofusca]|uniref:S53 family peptidase n=1 Tax=Saccharothrix coeruleofusca TaxID=33919 RepID=UPI0027DBC785|nr:S53 family peptidase [Saccharothrix coeruleofusca]MBP2340616.1 subtilase family serine protease [Saccharothrix coeruleofusca]